MKTWILDDDPMATVEVHAVKPVNPILEEHCKDCCCSRSWKALGITAYSRKSIPEHIEGLKADAETLNNEINELRELAQRAQRREFEVVKRCEELQHRCNKLETALVLDWPEPHL